MSARLPRTPTAARADRSPAAWPRRRTFAAGLLAAVLFAIYGSLVPFELRAITLQQAWRAYDALWSQPMFIWSRSDFIANVLLTVPIGFCLMGLLRVDRSRGRRTGALAAAIVTAIAGAIVAFGVEFAQVFTSDRVPSRSDVTAQIGGIATGIAMWLLLGQALVDWLRGGRQGRLSTAERRVQALLAVYAAVWVLTMWLPLELMSSPADIVRKYRVGLVLLVPFSASYASFADLVWDAIASVASALPIGALALLTATNRGWRARRGTAVAWGVACVAGAECVQLLVKDRVVDVTDVLLGGIGVMAGVWLAAVQVPVAPNFVSDRARRATADRSWRSPLAALTGAMVWTAVLVFYHWKPFTFDLDPQHLRHRLARISLMPLEGYGHGNTGIEMLAQALLKIGLAFPLGFFLGSCLAYACRHTPYGPSLRIAAGLLIAAAVLGGIELGQVLLPARVPDVTDVMLGGLGAAAGLRAATFASAALDPGRTRDARRAAEWIPNR